MPFNSSYIGGKRFDYNFVNENFGLLNTCSNEFNNIFYKYFGRAAFALRSILRKYLIKNNITLHSPKYNCKEAFYIATNNLKGLKIVEYDSPKNLIKNIENSKQLNLVIIIDYFGITNTNHLLDLIDSRCIKILDLAHSFITHKYLLNSILSYDFVFVSLRKFIPVADGAILLSNKDFYRYPNEGKERKKINLNIAWNILNFMADKKYFDLLNKQFEFKKFIIKIQEESLKSNIYTIKSINTFFKLDLNLMLSKRIENYNQLTVLNSKGKYNCSKIFKIREENISPLYFPIKSSRANLLQDKLRSNKIYCPIFWPELESNYRIIGLPIDDRYNLDDMKRIIKIISLFDY